jgi:hypothetical protein
MVGMPQHSNITIATIPISQIRAMRVRLLTAAA